MPFPSFTLNKSVVLVGMMGSGKTAFGRALALRLAAPFIDADHEIERREGRSIPAIFTTDGEAVFRTIEKNIIADVLAGPPVILATGGGAVLDADTRALIKERALGIWLQASLDMLYARVKHDHNRPLLKATDPKARLAELLEARKAFYAEAPIHIRTDDTNFAQTLETLVTAIEHPALK